MDWFWYSRRVGNGLRILVSLGLAAFVAHLARQQLHLSELVSAELFISIVASSVGFYALEIGAEQANVAIECLLEAKKQTYLIQNGKNATLPSDKELLGFDPRPEPQLFQLVRAFWWRP